MKHKAKLQYRGSATNQMLIADVQIFAFKSAEQNQGIYVAIHLTQLDVK